MPKQISRSQNKERKFYGEEVSRQLVPWLNEEEQTAGHKRVRELLSLYQRVADGKEADLSEAMHRLQAACKRYVYYPFLAPLPFHEGGTRAHWFPAQSSKKYRYGWPTDYDETNAIFDLATLSGAGLLPQLRLCRCDTFFFQKFSHQRFCSTKCRLDEFRSSPDVKAKRNAEARRIYHLRKAGKVK
jgi:hypothetical protein